MECPRCGFRLREIPLDDLRLDECAHCGGVWFDFTELERLLVMDRGTLDDLAGGRMSVRGMSANQEKLYCPQCEFRLVRVRSGVDPDLTLHGCLSCYGRWVDGEEMSRIKRKSLLVKLGRVLKKVW